MLLRGAVGDEAISLPGKDCFAALAMTRFLTSQTSSDKTKEGFMDLDPAVWVVIILAATAVAGGLMFWSSKPRKRS
jgi:hypothetical protein